MYSLQKLFDQDVIEFRREVRTQCLDIEYDFYEHPGVYEKIKCCNCNKTEVFKTAYQKDWWLDYLLADCRDSGGLKDLCKECRDEAQRKHGKWSVQCLRCTRFGEHGEGKWNVGPDKSGRLIICYSCHVGGGLFCRECHGQIHYNK